MSKEKEEGLSSWWWALIIFIVCVSGAGLIFSLAYFSTNHARVFIYNPTTEEVRALLEGDKAHSVVLVDLEESCLSDGTVVIKTIYSIRSREGGGGKYLVRFLDLVGVDYSIQGDLTVEERNDR